MKKRRRKKTVREKRRKIEIREKKMMLAPIRQPVLTKIECYGRDRECQRKGVPIK